MLKLLEDTRQWLIQKGFPEQWPAPHPRSVFAERIEREEVYVARYAGRLAGAFSLLWTDPQVWGVLPDDSGYIHALAVSRSTAGRGSAWRFSMPQMPSSRVPGDTIFGLTVGLKTRRYAGITSARASSNVEPGAWGTDFSSSATSAA